MYENEPDSLLDIARAKDKEDDPHLIVTTSAAERKNAFLKKATEEGKVKRLDPKVSLFIDITKSFQEELKQLADREKNVVYESTPAARPEDVVTADSTVDDYLNLSGAKSIREKFQDPSKLQHEVKKTVSPNKMNLIKPFFYHNRPLNYEVRVVYTRTSHRCEMMWFEVAKRMTLPHPVM